MKINTVCMYRKWRMKVSIVGVYIQELGDRQKRNEGIAEWESKVVPDLIPF